MFHCLELVFLSLDTRLLLAMYYKALLFFFKLFKISKKVQKKSKNQKAGISSLKASSGVSIPIVDHSQPAIENVGVGMYPSLMGTFSCPVPVLMIWFSLGGGSSLSNSVSFHTTHMEDPWILPSLSTSIVHVKIDVSFLATMVAYQANLDHVVDPSPSSSWKEEEDPYVLPAWAVDSFHSHDFLDDVFFFR